MCFVFVFSISCALSRYWNEKLRMKFITELWKLFDVIYGSHLIYGVPKSRLSTSGPWDLNSEKIWSSVGRDKLFFDPIWLVS